MQSARTTDYSTAWTKCDAELIEQAAAGRGLFALGLVGREAGDKGLQLGDLLLIALVLAANEVLHELARLIPEVVVADIHADLSVVDICVQTVFRK